MSSWFAGSVVVVIVLFGLVWLVSKVDDRDRRWAEQRAQQTTTRIENCRVACASHEGTRWILNNNRNEHLCVCYDDTQIPVP